jgi:DNA-binding transcriptional regulator YiaG
MNVKAMRRRMKLNQREFWTRVGVTQSGGSRYESGRKIPKPVRSLLAIAYGKPPEVRKVVKTLRPSLVVMNVL